jgi:uroporphyrinogen-III synthase
LTSGAPLSALAAVLEEKYRPAVPLVALGPVTAEAARSLGFRVAGVATAPSPEALAVAVVRTFLSR